MSEPHRWQPGQSGNPTGRKPNDELKKIREAQRELFGPHVESALAALLDVLADNSTNNGGPRVKAANIIIERYFGKVPQDVKHDRGIDWLELVRSAYEAREETGLN